MKEYDEFTMSGNTIDLLRDLVSGAMKEGNMTVQTFIELVNLSEALKASGGMSIKFEFGYNS